MKILQLIDSLHSGGAERMCVNIANVLHENSFDVEICTTRSGGGLEKHIDKGVKCHHLHKSGFFDITAFMRFIKILRLNKIDLIHAHSSSVFWAVLAKAFVWDLKIIWHDHLGRRNDNQRRNYLYKLASLKLNAIIAVNYELVSWSKKNMKVPNERIVFINNFPILNELYHCPNPQYFTIVSLANVLPAKDHKTLLRAIALLKSNSSIPIKVIFAGAYREDNYYLGIKSLIIDLGLQDTVELSGLIEDPARLLSRADCGVLSSISEGLPLSLLEYGLAGLPVVVTDVGQCAEVVGHGRFGRIIPPNEPELLAKELHWIINNGKEALKRGQMFKEFVKNEYGAHRFLSDYKDLLIKLS